MYERDLTDHEGYELFRRAIVGRDDDAWAEIYVCYRPLLLAWARQNSLRAPSADPCEDLADRALSRAWSALTPAHFDQFPSLATLLGYLRTCVGATVIDAARAALTLEHAAQRLPPPAAITPEEQVMNALTRAELWRLVDSLITTARDRIVLIESFVWSLPPRTILERHPDRFASTLEIYSTKRNLLNRLERSPELQRLHVEMLDSCVA